MGLPIIGDVIDLVSGAIDKIWPDANTKEQAKQQIKTTILTQAMEEKRLLFQDTDGARDLFKAELEASKAPAWTRAIQVLARPFIMYTTSSMYVWNKISPLVGGKQIELSEWDYYLIGTIFVFLFGARTIEKIRKSA